jgi:hypothetical protein
MLAVKLFTSWEVKDSISCLVRASKVSPVSKTYPAVRVVEGYLEDVELVEKEGRNADIVLREYTWRFGRLALLRKLPRPCKHKS